MTILRRLQVPEFLWLDGFESRQDGDWTGVALDLYFIGSVVRARHYTKASSRGNPWEMGRRWLPSIAWMYLVTEAMVHPGTLPLTWSLELQVSPCVVVSRVLPFVWGEQTKPEIFVSFPCVAHVVNRPPRRVRCLKLDRLRAFCPCLVHLLDLVGGFDPTFLRCSVCFIGWTLSIPPRCSFPPKRAISKPLHAFFMRARSTRASRAFTSHLVITF